MTRTITRFTIIAASGLGLLLAGSIKTDYDHETNFGNYHTYSIMKVKASDPLWNSRIADALNQTLTAKGWTKVDSGGDVSVTAFASEKDQQSLDTFYDGMGGGWRWRGFGGMGMTTTTVENTPVGTLVVDLFDSSTKKLIWRGTSSETISGKVDKDDKKLNQDVNNMFKNFPPKPKD
jgi:hypothetical protein